MFSAVNCPPIPKLQAILWLSREVGIGEVSLISSNHEASKIFVAEATSMGLRVPRILELSPDNPGDVPRQVESFLRNQDPDLPTAVALVATADEVSELAEHLRHQQLRHYDFILDSIQLRQLLCLFTLMKIALVASVGIVILQ